MSIENSTELPQQSTHKFFLQYKNLVRVIETLQEKYRDNPDVPAKITIISDPIFEYRSYYESIGIEDLVLTDFEEYAEMADNTLNEAIKKGIISLRVKVSTRSLNTDFRFIAQDLKLNLITQFGDKVTVQEDAELKNYVDSHIPEAIKKRWNFNYLLLDIEVDV